MPIKDDYLSTSVRWALFKADFPDGKIEFSDGTPQDVGIPESFSKKGERLCIAKLHRNPADADPVIAFKSQSDATKNDTDAWHALCSKAMGRALKKAGYPDCMEDLRTLMNFRKANRGETETKSAASSVSTVTSTVGGVTITQPTIAVESKEKPIRPAIDWSSDGERDMAHDSFKTRCADLTTEERAQLREHHEKLNGKAWPMAKPDLNNMNLCLESIYASRSDAEIDDSDMVSTEPLKGIFSMLTDDVKNDVISAYGDPSKWPDKVSENEYEEMMEVFSFAEEDE